MRYAIYSDANTPLLSIKEIGYSDDASVTRYGTAPRNAYIIHYVLGGKGSFRGVGVGQGEGFLIRKGERGEYYPSREDPWRFLWIISEDPNMEKLFGVISPSGSFKFKFDFCEALENVVYKLRHRERRIVSSSEALSVFLEVFKHHEQAPSLGNESAAVSYARIAKGYIDDHLSGEVGVESLSQTLGVSRTYLYKIFVSAYGISPRVYLTSARILRAKELLTLGEENVSNVAREVGYADVLEFSKFFRRKTGLSPSEYRKTERESSVEK